MKFFALAFALVASIAIGQTITVPAQTVTVKIPAQSITITVPAQSVALPASTSTTPVPTTPAPTPTTGAYWVYKAGVFNWTSDFSFNASINYKDPNGIAVSITGKWGGFQPYLASGFDTSPYKYLQYCTKPTQANEVHGTGIDAANDVADGDPIPIVAGPGVTKYGPVPQVGVWGCYKIPLADFKLTNPVILKFSITDGTGNVPNLFYVDNVGFSQ